jgi:hypothetical protein
MRHNAQRQSEHVAISSDVGDHRHRVALDIVEHDHGAFAEVLKLIDEGGDVEMGPHRLRDPW